MHTTCYASGSGLSAEMSRQSSTWLIQGVDPGKNGFVWTSEDKVEIRLRLRDAEKGFKKKIAAFLRVDAA